MSEYPVGTAGYEFDRMEAGFRALPWWLWPQKRFYLRRIAEVRQRMAERGYEHAVRLLEEA